MNIYLGNYKIHSVSFQHNYNNIVDSINYSIQHSVKYRLGKELELSGEFMGDHFYQKDHYVFMVQLVQTIIDKYQKNDIYIGIGMPIYIDQETILNTHIIIYKGNIVDVQQKKKLTRYQRQFFTFFEGKNIFDNEIYAQFKQVYKQQYNLTVKPCFIEELENQQNQSIYIIDNIYFEKNRRNIILQKLLKLAQNNNTIYLNNIVGNQGSDYQYIGYSLIIQKQGIQQIDQNCYLDEIKNMHLKNQDNQIQAYQYDKKLQVETYLSNEFEQDILNVSSAYLYNQVLVSKASGFFIPISGGADSTLTALFVYNLVDLLKKSDQMVKDRFKQITTLDVGKLSIPEIMNKFLFTANLPMNFAKTSIQLAQELAQQLNTNHIDYNINKLYDFIFNDALKDLTEEMITKNQEEYSLLKQNIQARSRLYLSYTLAKKFKIQYNVKNYIVVLATGNFSEVLRGYYSKYDNSSGDINMVGSLCKQDIFAILKYYQKNEKFEFLKNVLNAKPSAELYENQTDEGEMGFTYEELDFLGLKWKVEKMSKLSLTKEFQQKFKCDQKTSQEKVSKFLYHLMTNRHKSNLLPPQVHLTDYNIGGCNDSRPQNYYLQIQLQIIEI